MCLHVKLWSDRNYELGGWGSIPGGAKLFFTP
jgi:hypothetical protein